MNDGTDIADAPADSGADISTPEAEPDYADEPVDLAELPPPPESDGSEIEEAPPAEDISESVADGVGDAPESPAEIKDAVDWGRLPDMADVAAEEPQEGEAVDLGHDEAPDAPEADNAEAHDLGESDLGAPQGADAQVAEKEPDSIHVAPEYGQEAADAEPEASVEELTEAAYDEGRPKDGLREEGDADEADLLADDAPSDTETVHSAEVPVAEDADVPELSDQADAVADLGNSPENEALTSALAEKGLTLEPVDRFDYSDNPVLGYRESAPPEDVAYAVNVWNDQIAPGIAAGATRDDFAAYDQEHGLEGHQRLSGVYDYMLGDDAIKSGGGREDGRLDVTGGRHRLEQARMGGVHYLPVKK